MTGSRQQILSEEEKINLRNGINSPRKLNNDKKKVDLARNNDLNVPLLQTYSRGFNTLSQRFKSLESIDEKIPKVKFSAFAIQAKNEIEKNSRHGMLDSMKQVNLINKDHDMSHRNNSFNSKSPARRLSTLDYRFIALENNGQQKLSKFGDNN